MTPAELLTSFQLMARSAHRGAVALSWTVPAEAEGMRVRLVRRGRRYPASPAPWSPAEAAPTQLADGYLIYDSAAWSPSQTEEGPIVWEEENGVQTLRDYRMAGTPTDPYLVLVRKRVRHFALAAATGQQLDRTEVTLFDTDGRDWATDPPADLHPGQWYYYTAFIGETGTFSRRSQAAAAASVPFGTGKQLFDLLPAAYHRNDSVLPDPGQVEPPDRTRGQLRRLMEVMGGELDVIRTLADGLRDFRDPERIPADLLPRLAAMIGWDLSRFLDEEQQRREVGFAPEIFRSTGTVANIQALVNMYTGWRADVRELGRRVLTTFDRAAVERRKYQPDLYHGHLGRSLLLGEQMDPRLPVYVRNRPADDPTQYTYEMRTDDYKARYSFEAIGIWLYPNQENQALVLRKGQQLAEALQRYLPAQTRVVLFLEPPILEESYPTPERVSDSLIDAVEMTDQERYAGAGDTGFSSVPEWRGLTTNRSERRTVVIEVIAGTPAATHKENRTWHSALGRWN